MDWSFIELVELFTRYLEAELQPLSWLDVIVQYIIPITGTIVIIGTAVAGVIKYYRAKNAEINEMILKEVYTPLYSYFVKQELYRKIHKLTADSEEAPILEITTTTTTVRGTAVTQQSQPFCELTRKKILEVLKSVNTGLASKELITLLNMYQIVVEMEEHYNSNTNEYTEATILKVGIEKALRKEIFQGFNYYYSKLGLKSVSKSGLWAISNDGIDFPYEISSEQKIVPKSATKNTK